jgi:hypothetical protein
MKFHFEEIDRMLQISTVWTRIMFLSDFLLSYYIRYFLLYSNYGVDNQSALTQVSQIGKKISGGSFQ